MKKITSLISVEQMHIFHDLMGITKTRATQMINRQQTMTAEEIKKFSEIFKVPVVDLITEYHCGFDKLTISDCEQLTGYTVKSGMLTVEQQENAH